MGVGSFRLPSGGSTTLPSEGLESWGAGQTASLSSTQPPFNIDSDSDWDSVSLGTIHGLAIKGGKLFSWGDNGSGRIGNGSTSGITIEPTQVGSDTDWLMVSAGDAHSLALKTNGTLWVFGLNANGQLGLGDTTLRNVPTQVGIDTDWTWIGAGTNFSAAVKGGKLFTCGVNSNGRTGQNTTSGNTISWTNYDSLSTGWTKVFAGSNYCLAIKSGELWAWGGGGNGKTGFGDTTQRTVPTHTNTGTSWETGTAGNVHSAMIKTDGTLWTFGLQTNGRLGNGLTTNVNVLSPTQVGTDTDWELVKNSHNGTTNLNEFTYAIKGGRLYATGINNIGQLGLPISEDVANFTEIGNGSNYVDLSSGSGFGMAIRNTP
jgi:alpha-tubulin suppressor-like RCC1 family protein